MKNSIEQMVIPAISGMKEYEKFLDSELSTCILMDFHLGLLESMVAAGHKKDKKILLHLDLIKGITSDEFGCEYVCQKLRADGVISTRGKVIEAAKKNHKLAILRIFLIDSKSLEKGLLLCKALQPDYIEVLPGLACEILPFMKEQLDIPIMSGGLIRTEEQIRACREAGACHVTISNLPLAIEYDKKM